MAKRVKAARTYHSPLRADQARATRHRVLDTAFRLFEERGYSGTPITAVADLAGVSPGTIYSSFGGKRGLLQAVIGSAIAGGDEAVSEDTWRTEVAELPDPRDRLRAMVVHSCEILARTRPMHTVIRGAADKEPFAVALGRRLLHERLAVQTERVRDCLGDRLRSGLSVDEAGQRYCALASPELYNVVTAEFGWTAEQHRLWLTDLLERELLG